ncbi:MAG: pyridoxamine 5'-phosphate oxidase family protein [Patescibacteria group bacterium]|jgi:predicted pyridoxine 5'-phosphate oxidase superfamily flavin-nucleotide-binding protein
MAWQKTLQNREEIVLVTSSKAGRPNAVVAISQGFIGRKLLVNDCQMKTTVRNIKENPAVCVVGRKNGEYYRIKGRARLYPSGRYYKIAAKREQEFKVKNAIVIEIKEVFDLDKGQKVI